MAEAARRYAFTGRMNNRNYPEVSHDRHISIEDLRIALQDDTNVMQIQRDFERLERQYELKILENLTNYIPHYPTPIEFHISEVTQNQEQFLIKYTTSPAFHIDKSRYGNFRFTFPLKELMEAYKEQMCGGQDPVLREYKTVFYRQEIMYVVLVHSPNDNKEFENFPKIEKSPFADYKENQIVWKAQAIGDNIRYKLVLNKQDRIAEVKPVLDHYYVWDHVSLAFHLNGVLRFPQETLQKSITCCKLDKKIIAKGETCTFLEEAEKILSKHFV